MPRRGEGFTLVELLIAVVIFGILLTLLGRIYVASRRAYNVNAQESETQQAIQAASDLIRYDVGLAGYRCVDANTNGRTFAQRPLTVTFDTPSSGTDKIVASYFEDRYTTASCSSSATVVTYEVSNGNLMRAEGTGTPQAVVKGVSSLQLVGWIDRTGSVFIPSARPSDDKDLVGIKVQLTLDDGVSKTISIGLENPQCTTLSGCLVG